MFKGLLFLVLVQLFMQYTVTKWGTWVDFASKHMPITNWTFLIACLAISGILPSQGFFSKDEILIVVFNFNPF